MSRARKFIALIAVLEAQILCAQPDPLRAIGEELRSRYALTTATADKSAIVKAGTLLTLKKSDLFAADATAPLPVASSYKSGRIARGLMTQMVRGASGTRTFVAGEKLWITDIEVAPKQVVFSLLSDQYSGTRYRASLAFPFQKGTLPSPAEIAALVAEVFDAEGSPATISKARPEDGMPPAPSETPSEPIPAQISAEWDPRYGRIVTDDLDRMNDATIRFDLNYLRLNPAALDRKPVMQYFVALNNCNHPETGRALSNELDYPAIADFYKAHARQILEPLPRTITDVSYDRYIGGTQVNNWRLFSQSLTLGEYDRQRGVFPLRYPGKDVVELPDALSMGAGGRDMGATCPTAQKFASLAHAYLPANYEIAVRPLAYREVPVDEASARRYIDGAGPQRSVFLGVDVKILDSPPQLDRQRDAIAKATFQAEVVRLRVIDSRTQKPLGTLFDDGSLRADTQIAKAPAPAPAPDSKAGTANWGFSDHMYDIRMSLYVSLAADACGWPLTEQQSANLKRFLDQVSNRGNFSEREQYSLARANITRAISQHGRAEYCANPGERRDFEKYAHQVAPLGPLAGGGAK